MSSKKRLFKPSVKIAKVLLITIVAILSTSILANFVYANDENSQTVYQTTSKNVVSKDMIESPKNTYEYREPMSVYTQNIEPYIGNYVSAYYSDGRTYITTNYPNVDITKLDEFTNTIDGFNADLKAKFEGLQVTYDTQGYGDAYLLSEVLTATYVYNSTKYNYIASFINTYGDQYNDEINQFLLSYLQGYVSYIGYMGYMDFGYEFNNKYDNQKVLVSNVYDEIYKQVSAIKDNPDEINKMVADVMEESIMNWVYEVDLDYFKAYQAQARLYLQNAKELGFVLNLDTNTIDYNWNVSNKRELILGDFLNFSHIVGYLSHDFLVANLNSDGTDFISPEEVYKTPFIQAIIEYQFHPYFTPYDSDDMAFYEKENIINASLSVISAQYQAISMQGSYYQPTLHVFNSQLVYRATAEYYQQHQTLPELTTWIPAGQTMTEYDQYRLLNYMKVPSIDVREETTKTVTRRVHYVFEDGTSASQDVVQSANFNIVKELISKKESVDVETQTLSKLANPEVIYPDSDVKILDPTETIEELSVTKDSADSEVKVVYPLEFTLNISYMDEDENKIADSKRISGRWNTNYSEKELDIDGYELMQIPSNTEGLFGANKEDITFVYKKVSQSDKPNHNYDIHAEDNDSSKSNTNPSTGDATVVLVWMILAGTSLLVTGYFVRRKIGKIRGN